MGLIHPSAAEARLTELRELAHARVQELQAAALADLESRERDLAHEIKSCDPGSREADALFAGWPDAADLMPAFSLADIDEWAHERLSGTGHSAA